MTIEIFTSLLIFALISTCTPGPNNIMLLASGMNYGIKRTIPHMLGVALGFPAMILVIGLGLAHLFDLFPVSYLVLKIICTIYLFYLAWKIATAAKPKLNIQSEEHVSHPLTFLQAAIFQWVNPKAWSIALTAISIHAPKDHSMTFIMFIALAFVMSSAVSTNMWAAAGYKISAYLQNDKTRRLFNYLCAALLLLTLLPMLTG